MKKYKLIKEYPGSPKLGHIVTWNGNFYDGFENNSLSSNQVENSPEYWEKLKNYEITEVSYRGVIYDRFDGEFYYDSNQKIIQNHTSRIYVASLNDSDVIINSVKRLSDEEVFTVGEPCKTLISDYKSIRDFSVHKNGEIYINKLNRTVADCCLKDLVPNDKHVFITEDNVKLHVGEQYYTVCFKDVITMKSFNRVNGPYYLKTKNYIAPESFDYIKFFANEEKANEYFLFNKPCLSINDVAMVFTSATMRSKTRDSGWCKYSDDLQKLVKKQSIRNER